MKSNLLQNISRQRYLEYLRLLPDLRKQKTRDYTMLVLTLFAITFFGIFAINPTFSTITKLRRELDDSKFVEKSFEEKIANLSALLQQQNEIAPNLPVIYAAVPDTAKSPELLAKLQALAADSHVTISDLEVYDVPLISTVSTKTEGYDFSINVTGEDEDLTKFVTAVTTFDRLLTVTTISFDQTGVKVLSIKGKAYFIPKRP